MKKALFYIIGICLALAACTDETLVQEQETTQQTFNVAIGETGDARQTKAAVTMARYMLEMYEGDLSATPVKIDNATGTFSVTMKKGVDYLCLFWADNGESAYDASSLQAVKQADETQPGTAAYCAKVTVNSKSFNGNITLRRAVAELSFIDKYGLNQAKNTLKITYPYASAVMNLGDGTVTYTPGEAPAVRTFTDITPLATATDAFAQDFILAPVEEEILAGLKFQLNSQEEKSLPETAVQANYQTKITGEYDMSLPSMTFIIDTRNGSSNDATFILPLSATLSGYALSVDWGDEETTDLPDGTTLNQANMTHTYATPGKYTITLYTTQKDRTKVQMPKLSFGENYRNVNNNPSKLENLVTPLLNMGTDLSNCFHNCTKLPHVPERLFENNKEATDFSYCFSGCDRLYMLEQIPAGLFENNKKATDFSGCFSSCSQFSQISEGLFANNPNVTDFSSCFSSCSRLSQIPEGLFDNNPNVTDFSSCFNGCSRLSQIPEGLFANNTNVTDFSWCFSSCSRLSKIPGGLFANNTNVTDFSSCFSICGNLSEIPARLFANNPNVKDFSSCFGSCSQLSKIPEGLFDNNPNVTAFRNCFIYCRGLSEIPVGLFDNNPNVTDFTSCFSSCEGLTQIPEGLFDNNPNVTNFGSCFSSCEGLTQIPEGLFDNNPTVTNFSDCFGSCYKLSQIPERLFANNPNVTNFSDCFSYCYNLKPTANIFCNEATEKGSRFAGKQMNFNSCFLYCGRDTDGSGTLPALWEYTMEPNSYHSSCFNGANATNTGDILDGWK